jgi:hypothetical protein
VTPSGSEEPRPEILESQPGWWTTVRLPKLPRPPRWVMLVAVALLLAGGGAALAVGQGGHGPTIPRNEPVLIPAACGKFVSYRTSAAFPSGYRIVLGDVAVPPAYVGPMLPNGNGPWRYWREAVFGVKAGSPPVTLSVPVGEQYDAAIDLEVDGTGSLFHIPGCPPAHAWKATAGGFYLKAPTACVPLLVRVGQQSAMVWFGLGHPCPRPGQGLAEANGYPKPVGFRNVAAQAAHSRIVAREAMAGFGGT